METARLAIKEPDDVFTQQTDIEQDAEELSRILQEKIESLERLNPSLECPAGSDSDQEGPTTNVVVQAPEGEPRILFFKVYPDV